MTPLPDLLRGGLDLVFAPVCVSCSEAIPSSASDRLVCSVCWARSRAIPPPRCERCWTPLPVTGRASKTIACPLCPELRPAVRAVRSAFLHEGPVRSLVHALKYRGWHGAADPMARRMAGLAFPAGVSAEIDLVVPVPLSRVRFRERGYNQSAILGGTVAAVLDREYDAVALERRRSAGSQTALHPGERRANVATAFRAAPENVARIAGRHVLLVDDVWTTGATALACADALLEAGARGVSVVTFARALPELEDRSRRAARALEFLSR